MRGLRVQMFHTQVRFERRFIHVTVHYDICTFGTEVFAKVERRIQFWYSMTLCYGVIAS